MDAPYRSTVTIDGKKFDAVSSSVVFNTLKDKAGMPEMGSLNTTIRVWVDFYDDLNMPNATLKSLFDLANVVTRDKIKAMKVEFWKDDSKQDALCSYSFKGWISRFETTNLMADAAPQSTGSSMPQATVNHLLLMDLEPALNQQNFKEISMSN